MDAPSSAPANSTTRTTSRSSEISDAEKDRLLHAARRAQERVGVSPDSGPGKPKFVVPEPTPEQVAARERQKAEQAERVKAERRAEIEARWAAMQRAVGRRYAECTLGNFEQTDPRQKPVVEAVGEYDAKMPGHVEAGTNLLFIGPPGTGKDHLMVALIRTAILRHGGTVEWINGMDWFGRIRDAMTDGERERDVLRELIEPDVLALSDPVPPLGDLTDFQRIMLYRAIDGRYRNRRPTWITANVAGKDDASARLGPQTYDRLRDGGIILWCNWASYRKAMETVK